MDEWDCPSTNTSTTSYGWDDDSSDSDDSDDVFDW